MQASVVIDTNELTKNLTKIRTYGTVKQKEVVLIAGLLVIQKHSVLNLRKQQLWVRGVLASSITFVTRFTRLDSDGKTSTYLTDHKPPANEKRIEGRVGTNLVYARIHELGGIIKAKRFPYLHFRVKGRWVRVKEVTIPARPYLRPALAQNIPEITQSIGRASRQLLEKLTNAL